MTGDILVMDDQVGIRTLIKEALEMDGHKVDTVGNGQELLEQLNNYDYDFIITDLLIPDFDSFKLVDELTKYETVDKIMVISGISCSETRRIIEQRGINSFLEKPFDLDSLKNQVQRNLEQIIA